MPEGCALEQIIFFDDNLNQIKIVKSKFQEISRLDRMALAVHELSYLYYRIQPMNVEDANWGRYRTNSSQEAREFSARLLMEDELHPKSRLLDPPYSFNSMPTRCTDDSPFENAFYSTTVDSHYFWSFKVLFNYWTPYLTYVEFPYNFEAELLDKAHGEFKVRGDVIYDDGSPKPMRLVIEVEKQPGQAATIRLLNAAKHQVSDKAKVLECDATRRLSHWI